MFPPSYSIFRLLPFKSFHSPLPPPSAPVCMYLHRNPVIPLLFPRPFPFPSSASRVSIRSLSLAEMSSLLLGLLLPPRDETTRFARMVYRSPRRKVIPTRREFRIRARSLFQTEQIYTDPYRIYIYILSLVIHCFFPSVAVGDVKRTMKQVSSLRSLARASIPSSTTEPSGKP